MEDNISHLLPQIRTELEQRVGCSLKNYKEFIDNEMLLIMAQMDWPSKIFDYLYLVRKYKRETLMSAFQWSRIPRITIGASRLVMYRA